MTWGVFIFAVVLYWMVTRPTLLGALLRVFLLLAFLAAVGIQVVVVHGGGKEIDAECARRGITKAACLEMVTRAGLTLPVTYAQGFPNANCLPCPKATSPAYWALIRKHYPEKFARMAALARELDVRLARLDDERVFIDDIPDDQPVTSPIVPSCDFLCAIAEQDFREAQT